MSTVIQLAGLGLIVLGVLLLSIPVGLIVAGVAAVVVGLAVSNNA